MNIAESQKKWGRTKSAVFSAHRHKRDDHGPRVYLYPRRGRSGYVWTIWHSHSFAATNLSIKAGGVTNLPRTKACRLALEKLLRYRGRAAKARSR